MGPNNSTGGSIDSSTSPTYVLASMATEARPLTDEEKKHQQELNEQRDFLSNICKLALRHSADSRRRYDYEWMVRDLFRRGYQFSKYQPSTMTVTLASRNSARIPVNLTKAMMRSIRNQVTSFRPKFEILPQHTTEESRTQARYAGKILDYYFDHLKMKKRIKETVIQGLMYSVGGPWQIVYDEEKREVAFWLLDPFDFYFDPLAEELEDCEYVIKAVRRPLGEIVYNDEYSTLARREVTGGENRLAVSEYKQFMIQALKFVTQYNREESPTAILFEGYFKVRDPETGKVHLRKVIWTDQNFTPLVYEDLDTDEYDFIIYQADLNPREILAEGWMKDVMAINRVINQLESSVYDYNNRVAKGRFVVDRDAQVRAIHNVHGEIISKARGAEVRAMDMPALPVATSAQIERMYNYQQDIAAVHDPSLGRVPPGSRSGTMLAEMKQSDSTGQDDLVDNLEDFLEQVARKILKKIAKNYTNAKIIKDLGYKEEDAKYFAVIGEGHMKKNKEPVPGHEGQIKIGPDWLDVVALGEDNNVRVTIGSWLGYTKEMMQEKTLNLLKMGAIDQKTFLNLWEFGDIDKIIQQTRTEQMFKTALGRGSQQGGPQPVDPYVENDMMVLERKPIMPDMHDDHMVHIAVHQEALGRGADDLVGQHINVHVMYLNQTGGMEPNTPPQDQGQSNPDQQRGQDIQGQQGQQAQQGPPGQQPTNQGPNPSPPMNAQTLNQAPVPPSGPMG